MKKCKSCEEYKDESEFYKSSRNKELRRSTCKKCCNKKAKENYILNKESYNNRSKSNYIDNKEAISKRHKIYNKLYEESGMRKANHEKRMATDDVYKAKKQARMFINNSIKRNGYTKDCKTEDILGCSIEYFKNYLESKFEEWMDWENKGLYNGNYNYGWDIDHIKPLSLATTYEETMKLNHYTNLQPLCSKVNREIKRDKYDI